MISTFAQRMWTMGSPTLPSRKCRSRTPATRSMLRTHAGPAFTMRFMALTPFPKMAAPRARGRTTLYGGERVVTRGRALLDMAAPLAQGSHRDALAYSVKGGALVVRLRDGVSTGLARRAQFV